MTRRDDPFAKPVDDYVIPTVGWFDDETLALIADSGVSLSTAQAMEIRIGWDVRTTQAGPGETAQAIIRRVRLKTELRRIAAAKREIR
jgi:hypothetical protein